MTVRLLPSECHSSRSPVTQELCLCTDDAKSVTFDMTFSQLGDCPIVVEASTGGELPCQKDGEGKANAVAVDRLTRKLKVEVSCNGFLKLTSSIRFGQNQFSLSILISSIPDCILSVVVKWNSLTFIVNYALTPAPSEHSEQYKEACLA